MERFIYKHVFKQIMVCQLLNPCILSGMLRSDHENQTVKFFNSDFVLQLIETGKSIKTFSNICKETSWLHTIFDLKFCAFFGFIQAMY